MAIAASNGLLVLLPSAIFLERMAAQSNFNISFYVVQGIELLGGLVNIGLLYKNALDGLRLSGRLSRLNYIINS